MTTESIFGLLSGRMQSECVGSQPFDASQLSRSYHVRGNRTFFATEVKFER